PPRWPAPPAMPAPPTATSAQGGCAGGGGSASVAVGRDAAHVGGKAITPAPHRLDELGIAAVGLYLSPQAAHLVVHRAIEQMRLAPLDHVQQPVTVEHLAGVGEESDQQTELRRRDRHDRAFGI